MGNYITTSNAESVVLKMKADYSYFSDICFEQVKTSLLKVKCILVYEKFFVLDHRFGSYFRVFPKKRHRFF